MLGFGMGSFACSTPPVADVVIFQVETIGVVAGVINRFRLAITYLKGLASICLSVASLRILCGLHEGIYGPLRV